MYKDDVYRHL